MRSIKYIFLLTLLITISYAIFIKPIFLNIKRVNAMSKSKPIFVIQKHDATTLHYDFRLEIDGVLKSWAVPKGPSTDPSQKHLAIMTEDHKMSWAKFEGIIPEGEYGAGTVMIWDYGTYKNIKEKDGKLVPMEQCLENGRIEIWLDGEKLKGSYALIRMQDNKNWLLIKMKDEFTDIPKNPIKNLPNSAKSGKSLSEITKL
ncbi:MAG: ligase D, 3'-phosphoesterase domain protein [candidate division TM6 bacterium GW2011_GWF2_32_72]|nr:MAG: ligase D, 3'-phosphoesterase domain protein [candidate division TM6 bacterium GW2011_GWF2_32_72]